MRISFFILLSMLSFIASAQYDIKTIYLLSGQGSDERIFKNICFDPRYEVVYIPYLLPEEDETMHEYAKRMSEKIDTSSPFALIGVSLGGMLSVEMTDFISPEKVIIISSASSSEEIPDQYKYFRRSELHKQIPAWVYKYSTFILQPVYEPDRSNERKICNSMIKNKDADFIKRATNLIVTWSRLESQNTGKNIIQIHGTQDHTIPIKKTSADYFIEGGSHMMTLIDAEIISEIINFELQ